MKTGDTVKVLTIKSLPPNVDVWERGKILDIRRGQLPPGEPIRYLVGYREFSSYTENLFERNDLKTYVEQSEEDFTRNYERDLPIGLALGNEALAHLMPGETIIQDGNMLFGYGKSVSLEPTQYDSPKIGGLIERTGYEVTVWTFHHATRWEPEDASDSQIGVYPTIQKAIEVMLETIFKLRSQDYFNNKAESELVEEFERPY